MASTRKLALLLALVAPRLVFALQVAPNSPCADVCLDSPDLDKSDPNSSNTRPSDMTCVDADYGRSPGGLKWQTCMKCLEKSGFSQGSESDQGWFLYNIRYNFNYCVFGFPNNTNVGSNPCQTSRACGALRNALQHDSLGPQPAGDYGYCNADGSAMTGEFYAKCLACISSFKDQTYVKNGLVALEAGCLQRPGPGKTIGVSGSIFSPTEITVVDPQGTDKAGSGGSSTPTTAIAASVIGGLIGIAALAAIIFMCVRKRRNRQARAGGRRGDHRRQSSLSFWCPTPRNPNPLQMFSGPNGSGYPDEYPTYEDEMSPQQQQNKRRHIVSVHHSDPGAPQNLWRTSHAVTMTLSPVDEDRKPESWAQQDLKQDPRQEEQQQRQPNQTPPLSEKAILGGLHQLTTTIPPVPPRNTHASPMTASSATRMSPLSATPTSATQLLPSHGGFVHAPYVPAEHAPGGAATLNKRSSRGSPSPAAEMYHHHHHQRRQQQSPAASPQQQWGWPAPSGASPTPPPPPPPPPPSKSPRMSFGNGVVGGQGRKGPRESGSPVESKAIQTSFPAPPRR